MRIISKDGKINLPYEQCAIVISYKDKCQIVADSPSSTSYPFVLGKYKTEKRTEEVFDQIIKEGGLDSIIYRMPKE